MRDSVTRLGIHRTVDPKGVLPQQARVLDASAALTDGEMAIDVDYLNIDSASWKQLRDSCDADTSKMRERILEIVAKAGKMHNPVTGSGGLMVGTVAELGPGRVEPQVGTRVCSLVSLTVTPLLLEGVLDLDPGSEKVSVSGRGILFGSSIYAVVPDDLDERLVLGTLDVCGAPAWAANLVKAGMNVVVIGGGGKSGSLVAAQSAERVGKSGRVLALCWPDSTTGIATAVGAKAVTVDATDPVAVMAALDDEFGLGGGADLVFVCTNVPRCEGGAILACSDGGSVIFFSMATSFTAAALTAEGVGRSAQMIIGNGYTPGHADLALDLVRRHPELHELMRA